MKAKRPYVVTLTTVMDQGRGSNALTRDAIRLEVAMRLAIEGNGVRKAWDRADAFVAEMDRRLDELAEPTNADRPVVLK